MTTLVKTSEHLRYLGVNGCGLTEEMFETVCVAIGGKSGATSFKLDAAANELGLKKEIGACTLTVHPHDHVACCQQKSLYASFVSVGGL